MRIKKFLLQLAAIAMLSSACVLPASAKFSEIYFDEDYEGEISGYSAGYTIVDGSTVESSSNITKYIGAYTIGEDGKKKPTRMGKSLDKRVDADDNLVYVEARMAYGNNVVSNFWIQGTAGRYLYISRSNKQIVVSNQIPSNSTQVERLKYSYETELNWIYVRLELDLKNKNFSVYVGDTLDNMELANPEGPLPLETNAYNISSIAFNDGSEIDDMKIYKVALPRINSETVSNNDESVSIKQKEYCFSFTQTMDCATVTADNIEFKNITTDENVDFEAAFDGSELKITFDENLDVESEYSFSFKDMKDEDGHKIKPTTVSFKTEGIYKFLGFSGINTALKPGEKTDININAYINKDKAFKISPDAIKFELSGDEIGEIADGIFDVQYKGAAVLNTEYTNVDDSKVNKAIMLISSNKMKENGFEETLGNSDISLSGEKSYMPSCGDEEAVLDNDGGYDLGEVFFYDDMSDSDYSSGYAMLGKLGIGFDDSTSEEYYTLPDDTVTAVKRAFGWHQVVFDMRGENAVCYLDGVKVSETAVDKTAALRIKSDSSNVPFDNARFYNITGSLCYVKNVVIRGNTKTGSELTGEYGYFDDDGVETDVEEGSVYRWLYSSSENGDYKEISGENDKKYTVSSLMEGKYIKFEVTPKNRYDLGKAVISNAVLIASTGNKGGGSGSGGGFSGYSPINIAPKTEDTEKNEDNKNSQEVNKGFADVPESFWGYKEISEMSKKGILNGVGNGNFEPGRNVTRAEFLCGIIKTLNIKIEEYNNEFSDVEADSWFAPYAASAVKNGIAMGYNGEFNPDNFITREEAAVIIARACGLIKTDEMTFSDSGSISDWAVDSVKCVYKAGIIMGKDNNVFAPADFATRAEMAVMLYRLVK